VADVPNVDRDRDAQGRARNARPRDELGRPLPRTAREQLRAADEAAALPPDQALAEAQELIDDGRPFYAHEVLEAVWHVAPDDERDFWQGLAQVAVGLTHVQRGNAAGAVTLLRRGAGKVARHAADDHGVDLSAVVSAATELAARIESDGLDWVQPADLVIRLRRSADPTN
jgi:hypothetical protein